MTSEFRVGREVQKKPSNIGHYRVKIVGHGRWVENGRKMSDIIYGSSLFLFCAIFLEFLTPFPFKGGSHLTAIEPNAPSR